jgi:hypothetical protein
MIRRAALSLLLLLGSSCAPAALPVARNHPASASAPTGRLAGPPAALRPGIAGEIQADPAPPAADAAAGGHEHHHGASPTPDTPAPAPEKQP